MNNSYLNSDSVCEGLEKARKQYPDQYLYIILDNAAYQRCSKVKSKAEELNINVEGVQRFQGAQGVHLTVAQFT